MDEIQIYDLSRRGANAKLGFFTHLTVYIVVNLLLIASNLFSPAGHYWFVWPMLGWGVGICFHLMGTFMFLSGSGFKERMVQWAFEKMSAERIGK